MTHGRGNIIIKIAICSLLMAISVPQARGIIYPKSSAPNGYYYYPIPNDTIGPSMFLADVYKFYQAMELRTDSIKSSLTSDMEWGVLAMLKRQVPGFGFQPSTTVAPTLYNIIVESYDIFSHASSYKSLVKRVRPCRRLREKTFGVEGENAPDFAAGKSSEFSHPSSHASASWGIALVLMCVNPWKADTIVNRGLAHSQSRVIGGVHWQSDVDAGKVLATANYARMLSYPAVLDMIDSAKRETQTILGKEVAPSFDQLLASDDTLSLLTAQLPAPYDMSTLVGSSDMAVLVDKMSKCSNTVVQAARSQVDLSTSNLLSCFTSQMGTNVTAETHPATYALVDYHLRMCRKMCALMQGRYHKPRPVDIFEDLIPRTGEDIDSLRSNSPYPSLHSAMGWTTAMVLAMMKISNQNNILKQGVAIGDNRVSAGSTWYSDVEMGRVVASIAFGYTTSCSEYTNMVRAALAEFAISGTKN